MENLIVPKNGLAQDIKFADIKNTIVLRLEKIENLQDYKLNHEFLVLACNLIEHFVKKKFNIDKQSLLISIYDRLFQNLTDDDKAQIKSNLQFIYDNGHIKKVPNYKLFCVSLTEWLKKKVS
jgi:hypothetical protein